MNKVFLENLPTKNEYKNKRIDWEKSVGHKIRFIFDGIEDYFEIIEYKLINKHPKVKIKYNNKEFEVYTNTLMYCKIKNIVKSNEDKFNFKSDFIYEIGQNIKDSKRDLIILDREYRYNKKGYNEKWYRCKCNKCGFDCTKHWNSKSKEYNDKYWIRETNLYNKQTGCPCCCPSPQIVVKGINDIFTIRPDLVKYFKNIEDTYIHSCGSSDNAFLICPDCGYEKENRISSLERQEFSCQKCGDGISIPNKIMLSVLEQLNVNFYAEKRFGWCNYINPFKNKKNFGIYDFYIPSMNLIIEMDGGLGHGNKSYELTSEESSFIDNEKDRLANEHGIEVIRIDCDYKDIRIRFKYIKNKLLEHSRLNTLLDLSNVDWDMCNKFSIKNLTKEVCEYWKLHNEINNENIGTTHLMKIFNKNSVTSIIKYLKIGTELGWCNYDPVKAQKIGQSKTNETYKHIEIFKDKISLGIFTEGIMELDNKSEELFGVKLDYRGISSVCNGNSIQHKGFQFQYVQYDEFGNYIKQELKQFKKTPYNPVIMIKDEIELKEFSSITDLINNSEKLFGVSFSYKSVIDVCTGKKLNCKGYFFKYKFK